MESFDLTAALQQAATSAPAEPEQPPAQPIASSLGAVPPPSAVVPPTELAPAQEPAPGAETPDEPTTPPPGLPQFDPALVPALRAENERLQRSLSEREAQDAQRIVAEMQRRRAEEAYAYQDLQRRLPTLEPAEAQAAWASFAYRQQQRINDEDAVKAHVTQRQVRQAQEAVMATAAEKWVDHVADAFQLSPTEKAQMAHRALSAGINDPNALPILAEAIAGARQQARQQAATAQAQQRQARGADAAGGQRGAALPANIEPGSDEHLLAIFAANGRPFVPA